MSAYRRTPRGDPTQGGGMKRVNEFNSEMTSSLEEALIADFPYLFEKGLLGLQDAAITCGDGWEPILPRLFEVLEPAARARGLRLVQRQEQLGRLPLHTNPPTDETRPP